jgi:molybdate transport system ATP-binding protein
MSLSVAIRHRFPGFSLNVAFEAPTPGVTALFGPSGCGKSTILAVLSGLLRPQEANLRLDETVLSDATIWIPTEKRRFGFVFQDSRLFPHLSVAKNLRYGLRRAPTGDIAFSDVVELLGLAHLLDRRPRTLSGGERSRVAIGRALLAQPRLLLMDEPLAALDAERRAEILPYLARLKHHLSLPIVYVTHAFDEVALLADTLVLLEAGQVLAAGPVEEVAARSDLVLARRDEAAAILLATIIRHDPERRLTEIAAAGRIFLVPLVAAGLGSSVRLRIPAREIVIATSAPEAISIHNILPATVYALTADPAHHATLVQVELEGGFLLARITPDAVSQLGLAPGQPVLAMVKSVAIEVLLG